MWILGIQKQGYGSICLLKDGEVVLHLSEERLSRNKKFPFPFKCIERIKNYTTHIDVVVFTGYNVISDQNKILYQMLLNDNLVDEKNGWIEYHQSHHLYHASNAFYNSGFDRALCVVWDGYGSEFQLVNGNLGVETTTFFDASYPANINPISKNILVERRIIFSETDHTYNPDADPRLNTLKNPLPDCSINFKYDLDIGTMYQAVSLHLGFGADECGKTMGLSAYGKEDNLLPPIMIKDFANMNLFINGHYNLNTDLYPGLNPKNLAYSLQKSIEKYGFRMVSDMLIRTGHKNLVISGGVGLNVCLNYYLRKNLPKDINMYIEPNCEDVGNSVGAAKIIWHSAAKDMTKRPLVSCYMGEPPSYEYTLYENEVEELVDYSTVANLICAGNIVALFQGRSEAGPRALGNRSILFDPRVPNGKDIVNTVKNREWFRPFAASILKEDVNDWFDMAGLEESPYMMYAVNSLGEVKEKIPSVIHVDGTCRVQTVTEKQNLHYYRLINEFKKITGIPLLFNTSFNLAGEPIVETVKDALNTFRNSKIDYLYLPEIGKLISKALKH